MAASTGALTGLGGAITTIVTLPVSIGGPLVINTRMVAAIAPLRGYRLGDPHTVSMIAVVVAGSNIQTAFGMTAREVAQRASIAAIKKLPIGVVRAINKKVGFMLIAKYGTQRSSITLIKLVPLAGGVAGAGLDYTFTRTIGLAAAKQFASTDPS